MTATRPVNPSWEAFERAHPIIVAETLDCPHPMTRRTAAAWERVRRRDTTEPQPNWDECFDLSVSARQTARALLLVDALLKACEARGFGLRSGPAWGHHGIVVEIDGVEITLRLVERGFSVTWLSLETSKGCRRKVWKDSARRPLERRLNQIMIDLRLYAARSNELRRSYEEQCAKRLEIEQKRADLRERVAEEQAALDELMVETECWSQARTVRAYAAAVKSWAEKNGTANDWADWVGWAIDQADRLDPLRSSPLSILDTPLRQYRELSMHEMLDDDGNIEVI